MEPVVARLLRPLVDKGYSLPAQGEYFQTHPTRFQQEVRKDGLAVERIGRVWQQLGAVGQGYPLATPKKIVEASEVRLLPDSGKGHRLKTRDGGLNRVRTRTGA